LLFGGIIKLREREKERETNPTPEANAEASKPKPITGEGASEVPSFAIRCERHAVSALCNISSAQSDAHSASMCFAFSHSGTRKDQRNFPLEFQRNTNSKSPLPTLGETSAASGARWTVANIHIGGTSAASGAR
jgi:hypothetical protein